MIGKNLKGSRRGRG